MFIKKKLTIVFFCFLFASPLFAYDFKNFKYGEFELVGITLAEADTFDFQKINKMKRIVITEKRFEMFNGVVLCEPPIINKMKAVQDRGSGPYYGIKTLATFNIGCEGNGPLYFDVLDDRTIQIYYYGWFFVYKNRNTNN
ncbi:MAG: hypothetical protein OEV94_06505 [Deltaproteobacteria bacterium]|nr:hypothetical protein [Deltaproteobacteria bacterium]